MKTYKIENTETGTVIETGLTELEAKESLKRYEDEDKADENYVEDFYSIVEEVENYLIIDTTSNHSGVYIGDGNELYSLESNAYVFTSEKDAKAHIKEIGAEEWAAVQLTGYPANM